MPPPLTLKVELGPFEGAVFESGTRLKHITIGRTKTNRFQIKDETISQKHMSIDWINDVWMAQDLGSSNGTTINGESIGVKMPVRVRNGDLVRIGIDTRIRIVMDEVLAPKPLSQVKEDEELEEVEAVVEQPKAKEQEQAKPQERQQQEQMKLQEQEISNPQEQQQRELQELQEQQTKPQGPKEPTPQAQSQAPLGIEVCGEMSLRDWFKQELVRIPMVLRERAEANIREIELHAEQLKARLLTR